MAFPDGQDAPVKPPQSPANLSVSFNVVMELAVPEPTVALWCVGEAASGMPVPEATIHEDDRASPWEDDIRFTRKIGAVRIRPVPKTPENL